MNKLRTELLGKVEELEAELAKTKKQLKLAAEAPRGGGDSTGGSNDLSARGGAVQADPGSKATPGSKLWLLKRMPVLSNMKTYF